MMKQTLTLIAFSLLTGCVTARRSVISALGSDGPDQKKPSETLAPIYDGADADRPRIAVRLALVTKGLSMPTDIAPVPGTDDLLVLEKTGGGVLVAAAGGAPRALFAVAVDDAVEQGLLGVAFHPRFAEMRTFYLNYNPKGGEPRTRIAAWTWPKDGKPRETKILLEVPQPYQNHKGGQLVFGPDGRLYVGLGDGGWADDPHGNGQNPQALLGKMLRLDVDSDGTPKPEIWAIGLRNPWRYSFSAAGDLIVGDVGQDTEEEITLLPKGGNAGWSVMEGRRCFKPKAGCKTAGLVMPNYVYGRSEGQSVTGGFEYTGKAIGKLKGSYVFADYVSGRLWAIPTPTKAGAATPAGEVKALGRFGVLPATFGRGKDGELYVGALDAGAVYKVVP